MNLHAGLEAILAAAGVAGPFVYGEWPTGPEGAPFHTMVRVSGGSRGDRQRQWVYPAVSVFTRSELRVTAEAQAVLAYQALHGRESYQAGDTFIPWSECSGWPRLVGKDARGFWVFRLDADLHLAAPA